MMQKGNKKDQVYENLKQRIIACELLPGLPINENNFAVELGVSKTPVREALRQLEREGFVENVPGRGSTVSHITSQEIKDIIEIREIIESGVAKRLAKLKGHPIIINALNKNMEALKELEKASNETGDCEKCDDIHLVIISSLENQALSRMYSGILDRITRIRTHYGRSFTPRRTQDIVSEHIGILEAILDGDSVLAEERMLEHLQNAGAFLTGLN